MHRPIDSPIDANSAPSVYTVNMQLPTRQTNNLVEGAVEQWSKSNNRYKKCNSKVGIIRSFIQQFIYLRCWLKYKVSSLLNCCGTTVKSHARLPSVEDLKNQWNEQLSKWWISRVLKKPRIVKNWNAHFDWTLANFFVDKRKIAGRQLFFYYQ